MNRIIATIVLSYIAINIIFLILRLIGYDGFLAVFTTVCVFTLIPAMVLYATIRPKSAQHACTSHETHIIIVIKR